MIGRATDRNPFFVEELLHHLVETGAMTLAPAAGPRQRRSGISASPKGSGKCSLSAWRACRPDRRAAAGGRRARPGVRVHPAQPDDRLGGHAGNRCAGGGTAGRCTQRARQLLGGVLLVPARPVREVLYGDLSLPRRQGLHLRAAAAIQASGPLDATRIAATALHLRQAGPLADQAKVVEQSLKASEAAVTVYAWDEAVAHLRAAFETLERAGAPLAERARVAERLGVLVHKAGTDLVEGIGHLEWALAAYESAGDRQAAARTHSRLGMHLTTYPATLDVAAGLAHYQAAESQLARQPGRRQLGYLYIGMAMGATFGVRTERLEAASQRALELAAELGDESLAGWASYQRAWSAFNRGQLAESLSLHERMRDTAARLDDVGMGSWAAFGRAILSGMYLADPLTVHTWCTRGLALPHLEALPRQRDSLLDQLGRAKGSSGELAEARRIAAGLGPGTVLERMLLYWSGDWEQSEAAWAAAGDRDASSGDRLDGTLNAYWLGRVRRLLTAHEAAEAALAEGLAMALQGPRSPPR